MRKTVVFIAMSLDGYIARENGDLDWLSMVSAEGEDYGYYDFIAGVDTVIMGRKTYDKVLTFDAFPHKERQCFVISRQDPAPDPYVKFYNDPVSLVQKLRKEEGKNIYIDGGAQVISSLLKENLIDEFIISIVPVFLGTGIPLFTNGRPELSLKLTRCFPFASGLVQLWYARKKAGIQNI